MIIPDWEKKGKIQWILRALLHFEGGDKKWDAICLWYCKHETSVFVLYIKKSTFFLHQDPHKTIFLNKVVMNSNVDANAASFWSCWFAVAAATSSLNFLRSKTKTESDLEMKTKTKMKTEHCSALNWLSNYSSPSSSWLTPVELTSTDDAKSPPTKSDLPVSIGDNSEWDPDTRGSVWFWTWLLLSRSAHPARMECLRIPYRTVESPNSKQWLDCRDIGSSESIQVGRRRECLKGK